jgi:hypothetical protein
MGRVRYSDVSVKVIKYAHIVLVLQFVIVVTIKSSNKKSIDTTL